MTEGKFCITPEEDQLHWSFENTNYHQIRECCQRLAVYLRFMDMGLPLTQTPVSGIGNMMSVMHYPDAIESPKICVVIHPFAGAMQVSIKGIGLFAACVLCDEIVWRINHRILIDEPTNGNELP